MNTPIISTERLILKPLSLTDTEAVFVYRSDPEITRFQSFFPTDQSEVEEFILRNTLAFNTPDTWFQFGIYLEGSIIGDIGIHFIGPFNSQCEIGYTLAREEHGKGYGQEAVTAVVGYLFGTLEKHRIVASLNPRNKPSVKLLERVGFRREGCFVKSYCNKGVWEDDLVYALLAEEWRCK